MSFLWHATKPYSNRYLPKLVCLSEPINLPPLILLSEQSSSVSTKIHVIDFTKAKESDYAVFADELRNLDIGVLGKDP